MKLSEGVEAAIHCAATLAGLDGGATLPASALAAQFGLSPSYLLKHLQALTAAGVLNRCRGRRAATGWRGRRNASRCSTSCWRWRARSRPSVAVKSASEGRSGFRLPPMSSRAASRRRCFGPKKAYRAALAAEKLSDIVAGFRLEADPRSVASACAFVERYRRPQKSVSRQG